MAVQFDHALVGFDQAGDHVEDGRLAGAVRPEQADRLAAPHRKADVLHHRAAAIALAEVMHGENALTAAVRASGADPVALARNHLSPARGARRVRARTSSLIGDRSLFRRRERSARTKLYFGFAASAFVAPAPGFGRVRFDLGTNCPCTRPDLEPVSTVAWPVFRS